MEEQHMAENLIQDEVPEELDERKLWKERLRKEILEEEKEKIMNFVESEVARKKAELEKLLEISGKPAKLVFLPKDATHILEKLKLVLERDGSLSHQLANASNGRPSASTTLDVGIGADCELGLSSDGSGTKGESIPDVGIEGDSKLGLSLGNFGIQSESRLEVGIKGDSATKGESTPDAGSKGDSGTKDQSTLDVNMTDDPDTKSEPTPDSDGKGDSETPDAHINGDLEQALNLDNSGDKGESTENQSIPMEEAKAEEQEPEEAKTEEQESEEKQHRRPRKRQKTAGCKWSCPLCRVTATSEINLNNHFMGKKHKMKSLKAQAAVKIDPEDAVEEEGIPTNRLRTKIQANGKQFVVYKKGRKLWCSNTNCKFTCAESAEMMLHLTGPEHVEVSENGAEDTSNSEKIEVCLK